MENRTHWQQFSYGTVCRWVFLWMPYAGIFGGGAVLLWTALGGFPAVVSLAVVLWLVVITLALVVARPVFETLPTRIEVGGDRITLWRHRRYRELPVSSILSVDTDIPSPYQWLLGGWIRLRYEQGGNLYRCYIGPYMSHYFDLLRFMDARIPNLCACSRSTFAWSASMVLLLLTVTAGMLSLCIIAAITNCVPAGVALVFLLACWAWFALTYPSRIRLTDHSIQFCRAMGRPLEVSWSDISQIDIGLGRSLSAGGFTVYVRNDGKLWAPPLFARQLELMICILRQHDKRALEEDCR